MNKADMLYFLASEFSDEAFEDLQRLAYGHDDGLPESGYSFLVSSGYLESYAKDCKSDKVPVPDWVSHILSFVDSEKLFMVVCGQDERMLC